MAASSEDTIDDVDAALTLLAFDQRRISDPERWAAYIDRMLDRRLELAEASR